MRYYLGHKVVKAAKIASITVGRDVVTIVDEFDHTHIYNKPDLFSRMRTGEVGDYIVEYDNGYLSLSPREALEKGYTKLPVTANQLAVMKEPVQFRMVTGVELQVEADTFDHYMVSLDIGYPVEATINNCSDPKAIKAGDILITYPTGRMEFIARETFDLVFNPAPRQVQEELPPENEDVLLLGGGFSKNVRNVKHLKPTSKLEAIDAFDSEGNSLDCTGYEVQKLSKTNPDLHVVIATSDKSRNRIIGYIDVVKDKVDLSDGVSGMRVRVTF